MTTRDVLAPSAPSQVSEKGAWPSTCFHGWKWSLMKTESKPTSSARHEKSSNLPGANCSAEALYPSLITARLLAAGRYDTMVPVAEIYRLATNQQPAKARKRPCISELPCLTATSAATARSCANTRNWPRPKAMKSLTLADHVLGGNPANPASGRGGGLGLFHDPFVVFGFSRPHQDRTLHPGADPAAAPDGARRQAGGLPRRAVRRPLPARHRGGVERGRVHGAQREFPQPRPPLRGAGRR